MRLRQLIQVLILLGLHSVCNAEGPNIESKYLQEPLSPIANAADAISNAFKVMGFVETNKDALLEQGVAVQVLARDSLTPFLNQHIDNKIVWRVFLSDIEIRPKSAKMSGSAKKTGRDFEVLLDPETGAVLRIYSAPLKNDTNVWNEPLSEIAEQKLRRNQEIYHGFPSILPEISLLEALEAAVGCKPFVANEIIAQLVMHSNSGTEPKPVWCITCRGIPPVVGSARSAKAPVQFRNRARCVVDATTGEWMYMTSNPQVVPPNPKEEN